MNSNLYRDHILSRLKKDLIGPLSEEEVLSDRPTQRYSTGILYPQDSRIEPEEDQDGGSAVNEDDDTVTSPDESGVPLHAALKPSVAGISFAIKPHKEELAPKIHLDIRCAVYSRIAIDDNGIEVAGVPPDRAHERWRRVPYKKSETVELIDGEQKIDLGSKGVAGLELYVLGTPHKNLITVTTALANRRSRGESSAYDEEQHFFQVELVITGVSSGFFSPRPSQRAQTDDDSRTAALIYRNVKEYVVGHTCSASAILEEDEKINCLKSEWIPNVVVPGISDLGDAVFETLHRDKNLLPLDAEWLAEASLPDLLTALKRLVETYREWISREESRINQLPTELRQQAHKNINRCKQGALRMVEGIALIQEISDIRTAFQLAQKAMYLQFGWLRGGNKLIWRPFQLAFQLLVVASLADRGHPDRETMDLLWFPTGGGKTEAYLALTAFVIFLRRLRATEADDGAGVAVLMRYTLRLLTVQQFQRAAAMICACELLRRQAKIEGTNIPNLGETPIGIGLWVGAAATPLTLRDAVNLQPGDPSTHKQVTKCPACGSNLSWNVTTQESSVACPSNGSYCLLASTGPKLPIWTIDEEIYRHAPSLLIGTVDKFAQIVRKLETQVFFGGSTNHAPPDFIIQDELHLISGPLGSIAGLYEVAIDELCRRDSIRAKIIGSTATIRRAKEQIHALFDRETYQFPSPGLDAENSGFAVIDPSSPGRLYVGLTTAGRSATYMLQALVASLLQALTVPGVSTSERDYYWTLVVYFNSLRELGRALVLMQDDVPVSISQLAARRSETQRQIDAPAELTSRVRSYEIRDMLDRLNKGLEDPEAVDLILASNMISVGMDIPRLGLMVVNAQPKTLAEYIQATSRVGRGNVPGLVLTMYNSLRTRDRSHYETFETWHRSLYRDVEATSVTPFASRAQDKALHAVLVALVRHLLPSMGRRPILDDIRRLEVERLAALIVERVQRVDPAERTRVSNKLQRLIDQWASRLDLQVYWDDFERRTSLLMSAEQYAAKADVDPDLDPGGVRRALWPTPNSMREVEAGAPFALRNLLRTEGN